MPSSYKVLTESHLVVFRPRGSLDTEDLRRVLEPLRHETPGSPRWNRFLDFTGAEDFDLDYQALMSLSTNLAQVGLRKTGEEPFFRVAILCHESFAFGMARMIASILERNGIETRAFRDLQMLRSWLELPPDALAANPA